MNPLPEPIIELTHITKRFPGVVALDDVSVAFRPGEIHAVIGENGAGKSTLMNILAGNLQPDAGQIIFRGRPQVIADPSVSGRLGISVVYQELALCPNLSAAENISLHTTARGFPLAPLRRQRFQVDAQRVLTRLGIERLDLDKPVGQFSVAMQQLVEIAKAIVTEATVLILDEPNSALTHEETEHLFAIVRQLRDAGVAILYVSHHLEEVLGLADRITVLRDGRFIDTVAAAEATVPGLIEKMVGRAVDDLFKRAQAHTPGTDTILRVHGLQSGQALREVSLVVRAGEVVGIAGMPDSGKDELVDCLFGLRPAERGVVEIRGQALPQRTPAAAIAHGMVLIPADRRGVGALLVMNVQDNIVAASLDQVSRAGLIRPEAGRALGQRYVSELDIRTFGLNQVMGTLSGGNQQKVILARGLATRPAVLVLHEPTRGIDVGAKAEIYLLLQSLARQGAAVLIVSSELPELMSQCDRLLVMHAGRVTGHFVPAEMQEVTIMACAMGHTTHLEQTADAPTL
ncbi:MAG: sugar ABC transporter ATP-binding protein [Anaerolineales bacterium]|nr:sugar ABC transporter ATP-binding protein [Anaerolineales bacterium]